MISGREIWVLINPGCGELDPVSLGMIEEGKKLTSAGDKLVVATLGNNLEGIWKYLEGCGASEAYIVDHPLLENYSSEGFTLALREIFKGRKPWLFLLADDAVGEDLAPGIAIDLGTSLVPHCVKVEPDINGDLIFSSPVYEGAFYNNIKFRKDMPQVATISTKVLDKVTVKSANKTRIITVHPELNPKDIRTKTLGVIPPEPGTVDIAEADVVVAIGRGAMEKALVISARELAIILGGSLGATRPVIDEKIVPPDRLVGRTGKTVAPDVYIALGISGSMHHIAGITESKKILSINTDASAPITKYSDENFVVPLQEVLPELVRRLKELKDVKGE